MSGLPKFVAPQVPILSAQAPEGHGCMHEIKHDGFHTLLRIDRDDIRAFTRGGHDWSDKYGRIIEACRKLNCQSAANAAHARTREVCASLSVAYEQIATQAEAIEKQRMDAFARRTGPRR